ncbi:MAG: gamma-glutamylcyclotransferase family protein [Dongiaceae bacterium]
MAEEPIYVFTYGSLKTGFRNAHRAVAGEGEVSNNIGEAETVERHFVLAPLALPAQYLDPGQEPYSYPKGIIAEQSPPPPRGITESPGPLSGEVYEVNEKKLAALDALEDDGVEYKRQQIEVKLADGRTVKAWIYLYILGEPTKDLGDHYVGVDLLKPTAPRSWRACDHLGNLSPAIAARFFKTR